MATKRWDFHGQIVIGRLYGEAMEDSSVENRVYLFKDLAAAWLKNHGKDVGSSDASSRTRALNALADIAFVSCVVADEEEMSAEEVAKKIAAGS